jgi:hypothetical protein
MIHVVKQRTEVSATECTTDLLRSTNLTPRNTSPEDDTKSNQRDHYWLQRPNPKLQPDQLLPIT